ncbi:MULTISPECIES: 3'-5' exonuclease [Hyphomicrobiales]|jgi:DNA polymerase III epsilon subunit family exonuclease|uniref:3'-5' exonuclease n=1 Tax=Methylobacterium sp. CCH7-A2 TaxID=1768789 RepID=UPI00082BE4BA|nr:MULTISPECIES: 3'-5' exonuclease [Hyphomicrobiales]
MSFNVSSIETVTPPADRLAWLRAEQKRLKREEDAVRAGLLADRESRVGATHYAIVSDRQRTTTDWQGLAKSFSPTEAQIQAYTSTSDYQQIDLVDVPDVWDVLRLLDRHLIVLDSETTGFSPIHDRIVSLAALPGLLVGGEFLPGNSARWVFNPGKPCHPSATAVHGMSDEYLASLPAITPEDGRAIAGVLSDCVIVAHNAPFDIGFVDAALDRLGVKRPDVPVIDTRILSKVIWPGEKATLDAMSERLGVDRSERADGIHDALGDCTLLARCLPAIQVLLQERAGDPL